MPVPYSKDDAAKVLTRGGCRNYFGAFVCPVGLFPQSLFSNDVLSCHSSSPRDKKEYHQGWEQQIHCRHIGRAIGS